MSRASAGEEVHALNSSGALLVPYSAALDLPHILVEWVIMHIVTREGYRRAVQTRAAPPCAGRIREPASPRRPHPYRSGLRDIRRHHPRLRDRGDRSARAQAPGLLKTLYVHDVDFVLLDGMLAACDRVGDGRAEFFSKRKRYWVNVQVVTDSLGEILWLSHCRAGPTT